MDQFTNSINTFINEVEQQVLNSIKPTRLQEICRRLTGLLERLHNIISKDTFYQCYAQVKRKAIKGDKTYYLEDIKIDITKAGKVDIRFRDYGSAATDFNGYFDFGSVGYKSKITYNLSDSFSTNNVFIRPNDVSLIDLNTISNSTLGELQELGLNDNVLGTKLIGLANKIEQALESANRLCHSLTDSITKVLNLDSAPDLLEMDSTELSDLLKTFSDKKRQQDIEEKEAAEALAAALELENAKSAEEHAKQLAAEREAARIQREKEKAELLALKLKQKRASNITIGLAAGLSALLSIGLLVLSYII